MALIPNKSKTNSMTDNGVSVEVMLVLFAVVLVGNKLFEDKVHAWLSWLIIVVMALVCAFVIFPSSKNYGRIGYFRLLNYIKYMIYNANKKRKLRR